MEEKKVQERIREYKELFKEILREVRDKDFAICILQEIRKDERSK
jgi:hypothetical protein